MAECASWWRRDQRRVGVVDDQRWNLTAAPSPYQRLETLANECEVWERGANGPYK
jgi:hypothetical protein